MLPPTHRYRAPTTLTELNGNTYVTLYLLVWVYTYMPVGLPYILKHIYVVVMYPYMLHHLTYEVYGLIKRNLCNMIIMLVWVYT